MKVAHVTVVRELTRGQLAQLSMEYESAKRLDTDEWFTLAYHDGEPLADYIRTTPRIFRSLFLRKLWAWIVVWRHSKRFDFVVIRHVSFDPMALFFSWFIKNYVSLHHAKDIEELRLIRRGWKGVAASQVERITGAVATMNAAAILGVTSEIAQYVCCVHGIEKPRGIYSNGINPDRIPVLEDRREEGLVQFAFVCGSFNEWHGLDKLIEAVDRSNDKDVRNLQIHLIGKLSREQIEQIESDERRLSVFKRHGVLSSEQYRTILAKCHAGIGSLAMERQSLREGSTLKVREMLALGLPVYSGHFDVAFPEGAEFVRVVDGPSISDMLDFAERSQSCSRAQVREASLAGISKLAAMQKALSSLDAVR